MATLDRPIDVLDEVAPLYSRRVNIAARRTLLTAFVWRAALGLADKAGRVIRLIVVDGRPLIVTAAVLTGAVLWDKHHRWGAGGLWLAAALLTLVPAIVNARRRVMVGDFEDVALDPRSAGSRSPVDLGNLLQTELSRLGSLFRVVEDRRAVSSGLVASAALDATISVDAVVDALQDTVGAETKVRMGPISVPVAPLMALAGRAFRAPRLTGNLHRDGDMLILTARQRGHSGLSWRVWRRADLVDNNAGPTPGLDDRELDDTAELSGMVRELALRIFTDLALGRDVRWEASAFFVEGLEKFRAALRTPKDRKVNIKKAERAFLRAMSEDEDFPVAYYNLGVVYTELHGLAVAGGRKQEEKMHLNAAETSFKWAIEKEPKRWDTYLALAQTQFGNSRYGEVIAQCDRVLEMRQPWHLSARARARDLRARALVKPGPAHDLAAAIRSARQATYGSMLALIAARLVRRTASGDEGDREPRCIELAGACASTYGLCYSKQMSSAATRPVAKRARSWFRLSERLLGSIPDVHFELALRALTRFDFGLAEKEIGIAVGSDPKRSVYRAGRALVRVTEARESGEEVNAILRAEIERDCDQVVEGMAGAFAPASDMDACALAIKVYESLAAVWTGDEPNMPGKKADQLKAIQTDVEGKLGAPKSEASASAFFLKALQDLEEPWTGELDDYGKATRQAQTLLAVNAVRDALEPAERATSLNPLSSLAWETLGDVHSRLQDFRSAREKWEYARSRDPDNPELYDKIGSSHWQIAFDGHSGVNTEELLKAKGYFESALLLYGSGSLDEQFETHYRLGKLYTALGDFAAALSHLKIVEAVSKSRNKPIVGWQLLGMAHLGKRNFPECEHYFGRVISTGHYLELQGCDPQQPVGNPLDEREWPLGLVRAWGHLGLAFSYVERDGNLKKAACQLAEARKHSATITNRGRFPTRIDAACMDCEGFISQRDHDRAPEEAIEKFKQAVGVFPYSRSYLHLARAYLERARDAARPSEHDLEDARRALNHAVSLSPGGEPAAEVRETLQELDELAGRPV